ncbi:MAG: hypothetical protein II876_01790 [Synergistaceae bacterium]|nr:hypothetical protein [Synergistaceae bacterium]
MPGHVSAKNGACRDKIFLGVMNLKLKGLRDALMFGKVLSAGLVVAGYAFLGVWLSNWLATNGWPILVSLCAVPVVAAFGMWQGWLFLTKGSKKK